MSLQDKSTKFWTGQEFAPSQLDAKLCLKTIVKGEKLQKLRWRGWKQSYPSKLSMSMDKKNNDEQMDYFFVTWPWPTKQKI